MSLNDPERVAQEYASERGLEARRSAYRHADGPDPRELAFAAVAVAAPRRVLEVGPGPGELAERIQRELGAVVVAVDISPRMVELAQSRGIDARVGDVQQLPFADGEFDCAVAAWMLYHVLDIGRALSELARVLQPGGTLVAVTNSEQHLRELYELLGLQRAQSPFSAEAATAELERHFAHVKRRDAFGWVNFPDRASAQAYVDASVAQFCGAQLPAREGAIRVRVGPSILVARK